MSDSHNPISSGAHQIIIYQEWFSIDPVVHAKTLNASSSFLLYFKKYVYFQNAFFTLRPFKNHKQVWPQIDVKIITVIFRLYAGY